MAIKSQSLIQTQKNILDNVTQKVVQQLANVSERKRDRMDKKILEKLENAEKIWRRA